MCCITDIFFVADDQLGALGESYTMSHFDEDDEQPALKRVKLEPQLEEDDIIEEQVPITDMHGIHIKLEAQDIMAHHDDTV